MTKQYKFSVEELKAQLDAGKSVYDTAKNVFMTEAAWRDYMKKTYEEYADKEDTTLEAWCEDPDFQDVESMICEIENN